MTGHGRRQADVQGTRTRSARGSNGGIPVPPPGGVGVQHLLVLPGGMMGPQLLDQLIPLLHQLAVHVLLVLLVLQLMSDPPVLLLQLLGAGPEGQRSGTGRQGGGQGWMRWVGQPPPPRPAPKER